MSDFDAFEPAPLEEDPFGEGGAEEGGDIDDAFGLGSTEAAPGGEEDVFGTAEPAELSGQENEDPFGMGGGEEAQVDLGFEAPAQGEQKTEADIFATPVPEESSSPTPYQLWEEKRNVELRERREKAYADKDKLEEAGKAEIAQFYKERETKIAALKEKNREDEKKTVADMESLMKFGSQWEKVTKLVNLTPDPSEKPGTSKVDRLRGLLIQLKNEKK